MEFRILGPAQALDDDGRVLALGGAKQRATLAVLLLRRNEVVPRESVIEGLWGSSPPPTAVTTVKTYVSRLRSVLPDDGGGRRLVSQASGYRLHVKPDELDLERFEGLSGAARAALASGDAWTASEALGRALALFRGAPLQDLTHAPFARSEIVRLEEMRLAALALRFEADLAVGRHAEVVGEIEALVVEHPFREELWAQLMLALYRSGRQGDALIAYDRARHVLADELGVDPGRTLRVLHQRILEQDTALELSNARSGVSREPRGAEAPSAAGGPEFGPATAPPGVPAAVPGREQPAPGRQQARSTTRRLVGTAVAVTAIAVAVVLATLAAPRISGHPDGVARARYRPGTSLIDLSTRRLIRTITPDQLSISAYPISAGGKFWVDNWSPSALEGIDRTSGALMGPINLPPPNPAEAKDYSTVTPWAASGNSLWVTAGDDLVRMDARLGREADRIPLDHLGRGTGLAEGVAVGGGSVWVSRDVGHGQILRLTLAGRILHTWNDMTPHLNLAYGDGSVWVADEDGLARIDPQLDRVIRIGGIQGNCGGGVGGCVAAGGGFGWTDDPSKGALYKVEPDGHVAATYSLGVGTSFLSYAGGTLWAANSEAGTVVGIDAVTGERTATFRFGHPVWTMAAGGGVLLVDLGPGVAPVEGYIEGLPGKVARFFAYSGELGGEEPALNTGPGANQIESATCAKLLNYPDAPPPTGLRLEPEVAASMPVVSADGRTYTFTVRPGYRFSPPSNDRVTAETFRYSIERALSPRLARGSTVARPPGRRFMADLAGERAFLHGAASHISGLRASGDELTMTLTRPSPDFLERLALPYFCPVPTGTPFIAGAPHRVDSSGNGSVVSAGPYYISDYNDGYVILKRNPNYSGPRTTAFDAIAIREGADASHALHRIHSSGWDGITSLPDAALDPGGPIDRRWGTAGSAGTGPRRYFLTPQMAARFIVLRSTGGIFASPAVRRAAALALDRPALAAAWGAMPSRQLLPPALDGYPRRSHGSASPSTTKAKKLMGDRSGKAVMPIPSHCASCVESARIVQRSLGEVGIVVTFKKVAGMRAAIRHSSRFDLLDLRSDLPYPDPASFLGQVIETVPAGWVPKDVSARVREVMASAGDQRFAAAESLADRLERGSATLIGYGTPQTPQFLVPRIGCRVFLPVDDGVDLAHLCPVRR